MSYTFRYNHICGWQFSVRLPWVFGNPTWMTGTDSPLKETAVLRPNTVPDTCPPARAGWTETVQKVKQRQGEPISIAWSRPRVSPSSFKKLLTHLFQELSFTCTHTSDPNLTDQTPTYHAPTSRCFLDDLLLWSLDCFSDFAGEPRPHLSRSILCCWELWYMCGHGRALVMVLDWQLSDLCLIPKPHIVRPCCFGWKHLLNIS